MTMATSEDWILLLVTETESEHMNKFFRYPGHQKPDEYRKLKLIFMRESLDFFSVSV